MSDGSNGLWTGAKARFGCYIETIARKTASRKEAMDILPIAGFREPVSSLSHLIGAGVFAVLGFFPIRRGLGSPARVISLAVYVFATIFLLSMSGVYHLLDFGGSARAVLQRLDHGAIFVLIAGTFTPPHIILFRGPGRWGMLLLIWGAAAAGITL